MIKLVRVLILNEKKLKFNLISKYFFFFEMWPYESLTDRLIIIVILGQLLLFTR